MALGHYLIGSCMDLGHWAFLCCNMNRSTKKKLHHALMTKKKDTTPLTRKKKGKKAYFMVHSVVTNVVILLENGDISINISHTFEKKKEGQIYKAYCKVKSKSKGCRKGLFWANMKRAFSRA